MATPTSILFGSSEPGIALPSFEIADATMYQDIAGTTLVNAVEQSVGRVLDSSGNGNYLVASVDANRPTFSKKYNRYTNDTTFDTGYTAAGTTPPTVTSSVSRLGESCTSVLFTSSMTAGWTFCRAEPTYFAPFVANITYRYSAYISLSRALTGSEELRIVWTGDDNPVDSVLNVSNSSTYVDTWARLYSEAAPTTASGNISAWPKLHVAVGSDVTLYICKVDIRLAVDADMPAYQDVTSSTVYDTAGFPGYLNFDGSNDCLYTNSTVAPGSVDTVQVFAGLLKNSDAAQAFLAESSASSASNAGTWAISAPDGASATLAGYSRGDASVVGAQATSVASPYKNVAALLADISSDSLSFRLNGSEAASSATDQGAGNYTTQTIYVGARGNASARFTGRLYALYARYGAALAGGDVSSIETWIANVIAGVGNIPWQTAGPGSTVAAGSWTASTTTLHGDVDETTADNADYDYSSTNSDTLKLGTYGLVDPGVDTGFTIDYRVSATSTDQLTLYLYEGTTLRATDTTRTPGATPTDYSWAVPSASVANISDWSAIQTWLTTGTHGGATDTGAKFPTTTSTASETGYADNDWTTIANITADDTSYATITHPTYDTGKHSYVAYAKGFDFSAIPDSSTITGVECIYCGWYDAGTAEGILAQLCDTAGARVGTNKWATPVALSGTTGATVTIGGTGDTWGNSLTAAWVKDPDFGVAFSINATSNNTDISCDYVTLKVFYTPPAADWRLQWIRITAPGVDSQLIPFARIALQAVQRASTW